MDKDGHNGAATMTSAPPETAGQSANGMAADGQETDSMARAEEMVDQLAERMAHYTAVIGRKVLWLGARIREEAEDIWAEAQDLRQKKQAAD
jgi:hypothetical protein